MCGILGLVGGEIRSNQLDVAKRLMQHRGPDQSGSLQIGAAIFGHQRLSIIDLMMWNSLSDIKEMLTRGVEISRRTGC